MDLSQPSTNVFSDFAKNAVRCARLVWQKHAWLLMALAVLGVLIGTLPYARSAFNASLINELVKVAGSGVFSNIVILSLVGMMAIDYVTQGLSSLRGKLSFSSVVLLDYTFDLMILKKKVELDIASHEDPKIQDLINKIDEEGFWRVRDFIRESFVMLESIVSLIVSLFIISSLNFWLFLLIVVGTLPDLLVEKKHGGRRWRYRTQRSEARRRYFDVRRHFSQIASLVELEVFKNGKFFWQRVGEHRKQFDAEEMEMEGSRIKDQYLARIISQTVIVVTTVFFVGKVIAGQMEIGTMAFVLGAIGGFKAALAGLFASLGRSYQCSLFVTDLFRFLDLKPKLEVAPNAVRLEKNKTPEIVFENVSFGYADGPDVLTDISFRIAPGEKLAIVGVNGSGKTTLIKLLCGFYRPRKGRILVDGVDMANVHPDSWHELLTVIMQQYANYRFDVRQAIAIGRSEDPVDNTRIEKAGVDSDSDSFIRKWEKGYEQSLGHQFKGGVEPSTGQWQKLALARLFYRDSRVLVLDEPTSAIDAEAESKIFEKLESLPKDRTVVLISHRFSTVRHADRIALIENGKIKELGTHQELVAQKNTYERLFSLQAKGYQ